MQILAIDPGNVESGWLIMDTDSKQPLAFGIQPNTEILLGIRDKLFTVDGLVIEMLEGFGMKAGMTVFDTCVWVGRFVERWDNAATTRIMGRKEAVLHLCGNKTAGDPAVREALMYRYGATKKHPGALKGITSHVWSALAIARTFSDKYKSLQDEAFDIGF